jgi:hypothetical protein
MSAGSLPTGEPVETARERTRLSWWRTGLSGTVVTVLSVRAALRDGYSPAGLVVAVLAVIGWLWLVRLCRARIAALSAVPPPPASWRPAATAFGFIGFAVLGIAAAVLP